MQKIVLSVVAMQDCQLKGCSDTNTIKTAFSSFVKPKMEDCIRKIRGAF